MGTRGTRTGSRKIAKGHAWGMEQMSFLSDPGGSEEQDRETLLALYWSSGGPRWKHNSGWADNGAYLGDWYGVSLDDEGRVSKIDLTRNDLGGTIPAALGYMTHLCYLRLSSNNLTGPIPSTFGNLSRLTYLDIGSNQLTGSLPSDLGRLKEVSKIDFSNNLLGGPIPPEMAEIPNLTDLDLAENRLEGGINVEECLQNLMAKDREIAALRAQSFGRPVGETDGRDREPVTTPTAVIEGRIRHRQPLPRAVDETDGRCRKPLITPTATIEAITVLRLTAVIESR
eukprot:jgi/Undpi1/11842/HiC_scaffold_4.g01541.m1